MRNRQKITDKIVVAMREHFKDAKKYLKRGNHNMVVAGFKTQENAKSNFTNI